MSYDYKNSYSRIKKILDSSNEVEDQKEIPILDAEWVSKNGIRSWSTAIFIDIVDSTSLFLSGANKHTTIAKSIRALASEILIILKANPNNRQLGIRDDCVYGIYSTPNKSSIHSVLQDAYNINTFMKMFNKELQTKSFPTIEVGIGIATSKNLIIKADVKGPGNKGKIIADKIWIGKAGNNAFKLSREANRDNKKSILLNTTAFTNVKEYFSNPDLFTKIWSDKIEEDVYECNIINSKMDRWINKKG